MIQSMTAFAQAADTYPFGRLAWEIRSLNHRYLELYPHLPEALRVLEPTVRETCQSKLERGKLDLNLKWQATGDTSAVDLKLNENLLRQLLQIYRDVGDAISRTSGADKSARPADIMHWPGLVEEVPGDLGEVIDAATQLLQQALEQLIAGRKREGQQLAKAISERIDGIEQHVETLRESLPDLVAQLRDRLLDKVNKLAVELDPERLEAEVAMLAQKADVAEEIDRLGAHCEEMRRLLESDQAVGRRLDFVAQEMNREANTLGSKAIDLPSSHASVDLKVLIEQIREQVQNIQ